MKFHILLLVVLPSLSALALLGLKRGPDIQAGWGGDEKVVLKVAKQGDPTGTAVTTICVGEQLELTATADGLDGGESVSITITDNGGSIASGGGSPLIKQNHAPALGNHTFLATATFSHPNRNDKTATSNTVDVTVVGVKKIQYNQPDGTYADVPDPLYVKKGDSVEFKAIPNPSDASWPTGKPLWGGSSGASGTGSTISVTFDTASTSSTDFKTVTAECGNTVECRVLVEEWVDLIVQGLKEQTEPAPHEEDPGAFIVLNGDDDNKNSMVDKDENAKVSNEDDLVEGQIKISDDTTGTLSLSVPSGSDRIKLWTDATKSSALASTWQLQQLPFYNFPTPYIEGLAASSSVKDVEISVSYTKGTITKTDRVLATVVQCNLQAIDAITGNGVPESKEDNPGAWIEIPSTGQPPAKLVAAAPGPGGLIRKLTWSGSTDKILVDGAELSDTVMILNDNAEKTYTLVPKNTFTENDSVKVTMELKRDESSPALYKDVVVFSTFRVEIFIGADDVDDTSTADDWVGAGGHEIAGWVKCTGKPSDLPTGITVSLAATVSGTGSVTFPINSVSLGSGGQLEDHFLVRGGIKSSTPENITVEAMLGARVVASGTLTVVEFNSLVETNGGDPIPLNPARVNSVEPQSGGNLFGVHDDRDSSRGAPSSPDIRYASKISPDKIEVLWARRIQEDWTDSVDNAGLVVGSGPSGLFSGDQSNLRMRDTSFPADKDGSTGISVDYYMGHKTSKTNNAPGIELNHVAKIGTEPVPHWKYPVHVHFLVGPTKNSGMTLAQVTTMMQDINKIWSQAGVEFEVVGSSSPSAPDALLDVDYRGMSDWGEQDEVIELVYISTAINIYFVASIDGDAAGGTVIPNPTGIDQVDPGCIIGAQDPDLPAGTDRIPTLVRTIAHELGHYVMNIDDSGHVDAPWNLMYKESDWSKRDVNTYQSQNVRTSEVTPTNTDP